MFRCTTRSSHLALGLCAVLAAPGLCAQDLKVGTLLTKQEVQSTLGKPVDDGRPNAQNPKSIWEFKVGALGMVSITAKVAGPGETPTTVMAELQKRRIAVSEVKGVGEGAFFASPGYGMVQLNAFKKGKYLIVTGLVPDVKEPAMKEAAKKLMLTALGRL